MRRPWPTTSAETGRRRDDGAVEAEVDGERLTDAELKMFFFLLVVAGNDTARSALPGGVLAFVENPETYRRLRARPALADPRNLLDVWWVEGELG